MRIPSIALFLSVAAFATGCNAPASTPTPAAPAGLQVAKAPVSKIVFIDKEKACECTQKSIDASWAALQAALNGVTLPVERIHMDTQEAFAAGYKDKRPMMAVPGLYFLSETGAVIELLQGDVTTAQIQTVLK